MQSEGAFVGYINTPKVRSTYLHEGLQTSDYNTQLPFLSEEVLQNAEPVGLWLFEKTRVHQMLKQLRRIDNQYRLADLLRDLNKTLDANPTNIDRWDDWGIRSEPYGAYKKAEKIRSQAITRISSRLHNENMYARHGRWMLEHPNPVDQPNPMLVRQRNRHNPVLSIPGGYQTPSTPLSARPYGRYDHRIWMG